MARRSGPYARCSPLRLSAMLTALAASPGCEPQSYEAQINLVTPENQDPFDDLAALSFLFTYADGGTYAATIEAPFSESIDLTEVPPAEAGQVRLDIDGLAFDSATSSWSDVAHGEAVGFALPPEEPVDVFFPLRRQMALLAGGMETPRSDGTAAVLGDDRIVLLGGLEDAAQATTVEVLFDGGVDLAAGVSGRAVGDLSRVGHAGALIAGTGSEYDDRVLLLGGDEECPRFYCFPVDAPALDVVVVDPADGDVTTVWELSRPVVGGRGAGISGGRLAVSGGFDEGAYLGQGLLFDPATAELDQSAGAVEAREQHTATTLADGSTVLVAGGFVLSGGSPLLQSNAQLWVPGGSAEDTGALNVARMRHAATLLEDGRVLITGGCEADVWDDPGTPLDSAEIYDPVTGSFRLLDATLHQARQRHTSVALPDGDALICGGVAQAGGYAISTCEIFDHASEVFVSLSDTPLLPGGGGMMAVTLSDGTVVLMGGLSSGISQDAVYAFVP